MDPIPVWLYQCPQTREWNLPIHKSKFNIGLSWSQNYTFSRLFCVQMSDHQRRMMLNGCFIRKSLFHRLNKGFIPSVDREERMKRTKSYLFALARSSLCVYRIEKLHFFLYLFFMFMSRVLNHGLGVMMLWIHLINVFSLLFLNCSQLQSLKYLLVSSPIVSHKPLSLHLSCYVSYWNKTNQHKH